MQYKILASDYDNTLMPFGEAKPRPAVVKAVKKLQAAGGKFVLSTGRSYPGIRDKNQLGGIRYDYAHYLQRRLRGGQAGQRNSRASAYQRGDVCAGGFL